MSPGATRSVNVLCVPQNTFVASPDQAPSFQVSGQVAVLLSSSTPPVLPPKLGIDAMLISVLGCTSAQIQRRSGCSVPPKFSWETGPWRQAGPSGVLNEPRQGVSSAVLVSGNCAFRSPSTSLNIRSISNPAWQRLFPTVPQCTSPATPSLCFSHTLCSPNLPCPFPVLSMCSFHFWHCPPPLPSPPGKLLFIPQNPSKYPVSRKSLFPALVRNTGHTEL